MKKAFLVIACALLAGLLTCCAPNLEASGKTSNETQAIRQIGRDHIKIWVDPETGVQYIVYKETVYKGGVGGITPRLNVDGSLYVPYGN